MMSDVEGLELSQSASSFSSRQAEERGASIMEGLCLLCLKTPDLVGELLDAPCDGVIVFNLGCQAPVIKFGDLVSHRGIDGVLSLEKGDEPVGKEVGNGV